MTECFTSCNHCEVAHVSTANGLALLRLRCLIYGALRDRFLYIPLDDIQEHLPAIGEGNSSEVDLVFADADCLIAR